MSYRPTISVYIHEKIVDCGYYRNWDDKDLFYEAIAIAAFFGDCRSKEEYKAKMFGTQKVRYVFEPESFEATEENLLWFESFSEFPIIVDLTNQYIYASKSGHLPAAELSKRPTVNDGQIIQCKRKIWKQVRPARGDVIDHLLNGGFYDSGYDFVEKTVTGIGSASPDEDFAYILKHTKISLKDLDMAEIRRLFLEWEEAGYHLSADLMKSIKSIHAE